MVKHRGIALLLLLIAVAVIGMVSAQSVQAGRQIWRRDAEQELLHRGLELRGALRSFVDTTPGQAVLGPRSLEELLRDPRVPGIRRHLRRVPVDPMTGRMQWGLVRSPDGQILGVYSLSEEVPIKRSGFPPELADFEQAKSYRAWVFGAVLR
jgi:hypothetical protein